MIAERDAIHARLHDARERIFIQSKAASRVFRVGNHKIVLASDCGQMARDEVAPGFAENITNEQNLHLHTITGSSSCTIPERLFRFQFKLDSRGFVSGGEARETTPMC
jgi:hypothetical protein